MKKTITLDLICLLIGLAALLSSCNGNSGRTENARKDRPEVVPMDSIARHEFIDGSYAGIFEYSEPGEDGYLYYKMELIQRGDSIHGKLFAANYLSFHAGGYSNPDVMMECDLLGSRDESEGEQSISLMLTIRKEEAIQEGATSLYGKMNFPDLETEVDVTFWKLWMDKGVLNSSNGQRSADGEMKVSVWEKSGQK